MPVAAGVIGSVAGGLISSKGAKSAAKTQAAAADRASEVQQGMYDQTRKDLDPYRAAGTSALGRMIGFNPQAYRGGQFDYNGSSNPNYTSNPFSFNGSSQYASQGFQPKDFNFEAEPGYQFRKQQGMDGIQSQAAASGGLLSGATLKALNNYNSDLASQEYGNAFNRHQTGETNRFNQYLSQEQLNQSQQNQAYNQYLQDEGLRSGQHQQAFQNWQSMDNNAYTRQTTDQNNQYQRLMDLVGIGQNAAVQQGTFGANTAQNVAKNTIAADEANAAAKMSQYNALGKGLTSLIGLVI